MQELQQPLTGITVVEIANDVAAQYCGRLLAVLGARVIKIEPPGGSAIRQEPPLIATDPPRSALFEYLNIGKLSVTCDLKHSSEQADYRALLKTADILLIDTPVGQRGEELDPASLREAFPRLLYVSVLPFGAYGEHCKFKASELNLQHAGGEGFLMPNGLALEMFPDRPPVKIYGHFAQLVGGMSALCATLAALLMRSEVGGQVVDVSVQDANVAIGCFAVQRLGDGVLETRHTRSFRYGGVLQCKDGFVQVLVLEQHQWVGLVELMGRPEWALRPEFDDPMERGRRGAEINLHLREWARTQAVAELVEKGQALNVPVTSYKSTGDILNADEISERKIFAQTALAGLGEFPVFVSPFKLASTMLSRCSGIAKPGADNNRVFGPRNDGISGALCASAGGFRGTRQVARMNAPNSLPLQGVRVADFTLHAAGPFCTHILTMLGAQCIKIETAGRPDIFRKPHPVYGRMESATFDQVSSGKLSIRLNLKEPAGAALAKRLVGISDIVAESFRPGVMNRLGLDYPTLRAINPKLVMVSVSAAGQTGPDSRHAGYAPLFGAAGGLGALTGYEDGPPVEIRHVMDHSTGLAAAMATLAAYCNCRKTGQGQHVDVAARDVAASFIGDALLQYAVTGVSPRRQGNDMPLQSPHNVYPCMGTDNWVSISVRNDDEWNQLIKASGQSHWGQDPRYLTLELRWQNRRALDEEVARWTRVRTSWEVTRRLQDAGVPAFASYTSADIAHDPHLEARGSVRSVTGSDGTSRKVVGPPWRLEKSPLAESGWTPALGEHTEYVFGDLLGLPRSEIQQLISDKVIW